MNRSGQVRKVDKVGRVAIPSSIRELLDLRENTLLEFGMEGNRVYLEKADYSCVICGDSKDIDRAYFPTIDRFVGICPKCKNTLLGGYHG